MTRSAWIVGGGLAGASTAMFLRKAGIEPVVFERAAVPGGLVRSDRMNGVIYEPSGSHIFHTDDEEVWRIVTGLVPFNGYEHRVQTMVEGRLVRWPIMQEDLEQLSFGADALAYLGEERPPLSPDDVDFETWCLRLMGRDMYEAFVKPYTEKQWGRPASELAADFAPKRVQVRTDGDDRLFKDRFQGFPDGREDVGYADLIDRMLDGVEVRTGVDVRLDWLDGELERLGRGERPAFVVVTAPLDELAGNALGELEWRGLRFEHSYVADVEHAQERMVVNWPGLEFPWIRTHETKHASTQEVPGTVLSYEFTGAPTRYYPVPGRDGSSRRLNDRYQELVADRLERRGPKVRFVGRLAQFMYYDQDDVIRQALDTVSALGV
jgi:UDP-galactopyranose mutase